MKEEKWGMWINGRCNRFLSSKGTGKEETRRGKMGDNNEMGKVVKQEEEEAAVVVVVVVQSTRGMLL